MSQIRTLGGISSAAAAPPAPFTSKLFCNGDVTDAYIQNQKNLWTSAMTAFTWSIHAKVISPYTSGGNWPTLLTSFNRPGGDFILRSRYRIPDEWQAIGETHDGNITIPNADTSDIDGHFVYRFLANDVVYWMVNEWENITAPASASMSGPSANIDIGGGGTGGSGPTIAYYSNVCFWRDQALTLQQCRDIASNAIDPRTLNPTHSWTLDGDYLDRGSAGEDLHWDDLSVGDVSFVPYDS